MVITGASSGVGRCAALLFARQGWRVGLVARGAEALQATADEVAAAGGTAAWAVADVADAAALDHAAQSIQARLGSADAWVNCAGNGVYGPFGRVTDAEFRRVTEVTYHGTVNGVRAALKQMRPHGAGAIVNVCSGIAFRGMPLLSSYSGAKAAVRGFTEAVRADLQAEGSAVRMALVYPPAANTPFFTHAATHMRLPPRPMKPVYTPEVVAEGIWLAATEGRDVPIGGVTLLFGWAARWIPGLLAHAIARVGDGQMTDLPAASARDPALFRPGAGPGAAHGPFGHEARRVSTLLWAMRLRLAVAQSWVRMRTQAGRWRPRPPAAAPGPAPSGSAGQGDGP